MINEVELGTGLVSAFAKATGDYSSIHVDPQFARTTQFREPIVHGMLPVILLLARIACEGNQAARLSKITCRFREALKIGERVRLEAENQPPAGDGELWSFGIKRVADGSLVTSGTAVLIRSGRNDGLLRDGECLLEGPVEEMNYSVVDLKVGMTERLTLRAAAVFRPLLRQADLQVGAGGRLGRFADGSASAVAALSTLIGMRLPGRYATFTDFEVAFPVAVEAEQPLLLEGTVANVAPSGSRMRLDLTWTHGSQTVGSGTASTLIGSPAPAAISCAAVKVGHLGLGLENRVALVTGASRGIGAAVAKTLAMSGARVAVHCFRGRDDAAAIVEDIVKNGGRAIAVQADITDQAAVAAMFEAIETGLGSVDILVNNAVGDFSPKPFEQLTSADYLRELNVSLFGLHACCHLALPHMRRQRWGKIINMGTIATELPVATQSKYITAKSAVVGYTRSLAAEVAVDNVQVNLVAPSMTETSLIASLPTALVKRLAEDNPDGALLAPIDVAKVVLFLVSNWATSISGQQLLLTRGAPPFL
ncbi:MAG: 3-oxoacyl-[acyl-carrier protein] reductase [Bradyrhizobium sp.]|jgi:3-oxoacyl-[acyl-carrier protein] reductase|nr:3-oxoacyl-[acyl-carrier protein] reductase [Bradyrhizobium sp.]